MKQRILLTMMLWLSLLGTTWAQSNALHFDGTNDYVDLPDYTSTHDFSQGFTFTAWVKWDAFTGNARLFEIGNGSGNVNNSIILRTDASTGTLIFQCASGTTNSEIKTDAAVVSANTWHHVSASISSLGIATIYIDGTAVKSGTVSAPQNVTRSNNWLGKSAWTADNYFKGTMDEVSIWHKTLTQADIEAIKTTGISSPTSQTGLLAYYNFNQGASGGSNTGITTLTDATANTKNGTLMDFALTGTTSNWINGYTISTTSPTTKNALHFDGTNDYVACPAMNPTSFTVAAWVNPTELGKDQAIASTLSESAMTGMELHIGADNFPILTIRSGSNWVDVKGITAVSADVWTHIAATCNGYMVYLYVNGKQDKIITLTDGYTPGTQALYLGRRSGESAYYFSGKIDEASIWKQNISQSQITSLYERGITGSETSLLAYYKFDQGTADGDNSGVTTLTDATANAKNGTLANFNLTGTTSNWVSGFTMPIHSTVAVTPPALGDGTSAKPYQIATLENLYWLSQNSSVWTGKYFKQTANIDLAAISNWMPIGTGFVPFTGTYDGDGHSIRNLTINANLAYRALFGRATEGAVLKNMNFENANISNNENYTSILVAYLEGLINNCHTKGGSITGKSDMGSLCGYLSNGTITNCSSSTSLNGRGSTGGIVGSFYAGKIEFCHNTGAISGNSNGLGGIVGYIGSGTATNSNCTITNCYNTANITTTGSSSGGIIGFCSSGIISKCYSTGTATGSSRVGGLVGYCNSKNINSVSYSYCLQSPVIGEYTANSINTFTGVSTKTTTQLQTQSTFSGWDFVGEAVNGTYDYWAISSGFNGGYPTLGNFAATCTNGVVDLSRQPSGNVYSWYKTNGTKLTEGTDYIVDGGITKFLKLPGSKVYCTITNATFTNWIGLTNTVTVDKAVEFIPNITFVSGNSGILFFRIQSFGSRNIYIDWGNNTLVGYNVSDYYRLLPYYTFEYTAGNTVKMYGTEIRALDLDSTQLSALDVKNSTALTALYCAYNNLSTLDVSKNTDLKVLHCNGNNLSTLDVSKNTALSRLRCHNNSFSFATLPRPKYSEYSYAPQANLPATFTGGIVDLSSQLTATDGSGNIQTTVYTWYHADGTALVKGTDYDGKDGKFYFMKQPASTVYCNMTNAAFPDLTLRTTDITVDAVFTPAITFAAESYTGSILMGISNTENTTFYVDEGDGERKAYTANTNGIAIEIAAYTAGNTVKIFGDKIKHLAVVQPVLSTLDVSKATTLTELYCSNQLLNFQTLPQSKYSYFKYEYAPQAQFAATCTDGIVDLSSQLTAKDVNDQTQTTVYTWYNADGTELVKGVDYEGKDGQFYFMKQPASTIYCKMYNAAFPDLSGDNAFRTTDITVDKVLVHSITYVSENTTCFLNLVASTPGNVYFDAGDGNLQAFGLVGTLAGSIGVPVKIFGDNINSIESTLCGLTNLDVSNNLGLEYLSCEDNKLTSLDVSKNTALTSLFCEWNQLNFATLPQVKATYFNYIYAPQAKFPSTCINGVVDLSSQLTAKDVNDQIQTTVYTWYKTDGTTLTANVDYIEDNGVFTFIKMPATAVYCQMYNAAFPDLSGEKAFRTVDMTVDAVVEPSITFVAEGTGYLYFYTSLKTAGKIYVDWGDGTIVPFDNPTDDIRISTTEYTKGNTVKIFGENITKLDFYTMILSALDVSKSETLQYLQCTYNILSTLDVSKNTALKYLFCSSNNLSFASLPQCKPTYSTYFYSPQADLVATCAKGIVDLSSQLTAVDVNGDTLTTAYSWFLADNTPLTAGTDYIEENGVFRFVKMPTGSVYCNMYNAAFPDFTLRTVDITIDAVAEPNITFVSENNGELSVDLNVSEHNTVYVDWGNGVLESLQYRVGYPSYAIATTEYVANNTVKIYGKSINYIGALPQGLTSLNVSNASKLIQLQCPGNKLTSLDVSKNNTLTSLQINENRFSFASLPQSKTSYTDGYWYYSQANLAATCTNGVVDLSSQLTATDIDGNLQTTSYTCFKTDNGLPLNEGGDYMVNQGKIYFLTVPASDVYCEMTNPAFPDLTLRTADFTVDRPATLPEPTFTFASEKDGAISFTLACTDNSTNRIYIDWGDGVIVPGTFTNPAVIATSSYVTNAMVKVYAHGISQLGFVNKGLNSLDVSKCPTLTKLDCSQNKLTSIDVSQNPALVWFDCGYNNLSSLNVENNLGLEYLGCYENKNLSELNISYNTELTFLDASACNLSSLNVGQNTKLTDLHLVDNKIGNIDISQNTQLSILSLEKNLLSFDNLPQRKAPYINNYWYLPQAQLTPTITNGIVDLSSQLTAIDKDGNPQTTVYTWFDANGNELEKGEVYFEKDGRFYFVFTFDNIYCKMTNAAFPTNSAADAFRTTDIDVVDIFPLAVSLITKNPGSFTFSVSATENTTILVRKNTDDFTAYEISTTTSTLAVDISNEGSSITIYGKHLVDLDVSGQKIDYLYLSGNFQSLYSLHSFNCSNNLLDFESLPIPSAGNNIFAPQTKIAATCTNGVVDLKRQRDAIDKDYNPINTVYTWYKTDGTALTANVDYIEEGGVFTFIKMPDTDVYCTMANAVFPDFTGENALRTENITIDAVLKPNICFVSENSGDLSFTLTTLAGAKVYVDWGDGNIVAFTSGGNINPFTTGYTANSTVKIYGNNITSLNVASKGITSLDLSNISSLINLYCGNNKLTTLDVSQNTLLTTLFVDENLMNFASLPKPQASFISNFSYDPQSKYSVSCTNGVVDLSSQLTAVDVDGNTQTSVYSWYLADGTALTNNYMPENGVFRFVLEPGTEVYCEMTNPAFIGLTLRTENITIDAKATLPEPTISFVSENSGSVNISVDVAENSTVYVDWGDGSLASIQAIAASMNEISTANYVANNSVKVYNSQLVGFYADTQGLTAINTQNAPELVTLECRENKLEEIDLSNNVKLSRLSVDLNKLDNLDLSLLKELKNLACSRNNLSTLDIQYNTKLEVLYCEFNNLSTLDISNNPEMWELFCNDNRMTFSSLPQVLFDYFRYYSQANMEATCTNGIVDLSSQLTAVDKEGTTQTTVYTWYKTGNSSSLHKGTDYVEYNGVFRFLQQPDTTVYCQMTNAAFPSLTLGTEPIAVDDVVKPAITLVSEMSGDFTFGVTSSENGTIYIDGGNGELLAYNVLDQVGMSMLVTDYSASQTVRIFENSLNTLTVSNLGLTYLNVSESNSLKTLDCSNNMLSSLDLSQNKELATLNCASNNLTFATLPQPSASYTSFVYAPQANLNVSCHNGKVDLSAQRTAIDANGNTQTTVYTWYRTDGYQLIEETHYLNLNGVFVFRYAPSEQVYCTMTNAAFPGLTLRTEDITVDTEASAPNIWHGAVDTDWHTAGNWSNGVPSTIDYIEIAGSAFNQPVISSSVNASFLSIESGAKVTIAPTGSLRVYESLINNSGTEGLVIESDETRTGKLIYNKTGVQATVEQYIVKDQWHYITSPVVEALNVNPLFKNFYAVSHAEAQSEGNNNGNCWNYLYTGDQIVAGTGYGVQYNRKDSDNDTIVTFRGELVGPEYVIATKHTGANFGWNLVGNPYPCTISWNATQKGNIQDAVYVYDPATSNYMSYVNGLGSNGGSEFLAPMQGFFVRAKSPNATLNINHDSKRENDSSFKGVPMQSLIRLSSTDAEGRKDESLVRLEPAATAQFDDAFDAYKLKASASATPQLYSIFNGDEYSINSIPEATVNTVIPFELLVKSTGTQQIAATELTGLDATLDVVLEDLQTGARTLLANSEYRFSATAGETRKFNLLFADATNVTRVEARTIKAYGAENRMCISNMSDGRNIVAVYNLNGQLVHQTNAEGSYTEVELPNGLYVVKVTPENGNVFNGKVRIGSFK